MRGVRSRRLLRAALPAVSLLALASPAGASPQTIAETLSKVLTFDRSLSGSTPSLLLMVEPGGEAAQRPLLDALVAAGLATQLTTEEELGARLPSANVVVFTGEVPPRAMDTVRGFGALSVAANREPAERGAVSVGLDDSTAEPTIAINLVRLAEEGHSFPAALLGRARVLRASDLASEPPHILQFDTPSYPERARRLRAEGTVILRLAVDAEGTVQEVDLLQGVSRISGIDDAAVTAARRARVAAGTRRGLPIDSWLVLRIPFRLAS